MALIGYLIRARVGTAAPGCPVERSSTASPGPGWKKRKLRFRRTAGGGCPHVGAGVVNVPARKSASHYFVGGDETFPETALQVTLLGLRLMSNCYQSSHFHGCGAML